MQCYGSSSNDSNNMYYVIIIIIMLFKTTPTPAEIVEAVAKSKTCRTKYGPNFCQDAFRPNTDALQCQVSGSIDYQETTSVLRTVYGVQCTAYSLRRTVYGVQCTAYSALRTVYDVESTVYSVRRTVYDEHCTVNTVRANSLIMLSFIIQFI